MRNPQILDATGTWHQGFVHLRFRWWSA